MPMQNGIYRVQWQLCDRCGLMYPIDRLGRQQGLILCYATCRDNLDNQYMPKIRADVLQTPGEGSDERSEFFKDPGELVIF